MGTINQNEIWKQRFITYFPKVLYIFFKSLGKKTVF